MNLATIPFDTSRRLPATLAIKDLDAPRSLDYATLWREAARVGRALTDLGLARGERVAMLLNNSWEYVAAFVGVTGAGFVAVPMNIRLLEPELIHMVRDSGARLLIADHGLLDKLPGLAAVETLDLGIWLARPLQAQTGHRDFGALAQDASLPLLDAPVAVEPDALATIIYTSGTTGLPKGVMLPHRGWTRVSQYMVDLLGYQADDVTLHTAALTHGSGYLMLPAMATGSVAIICQKFDAPRVLDLFADEGVTGGFFVPSMIQMLLDARTGKERPARRLRNLYYAGSPIAPETIREAARHFGDVLIQSFAQTEAPMWLTILTHADHQRALQGAAPHLLKSAGRAVPGCEVRVVDDDDQPLATGAIGEVVARAPHVMLGYWKRPDANAETLRNDWLHTGDVGYFDADGYLYLVDRKKDMIISGGSNVYAREVEEALLGFDGIREVAVIGLPHPKWGEMVTAVIVSTSGAPLDEAALDAYARANIADYRRPKRWCFIDVLPRNAYGKVLKRELRKQFS